MQASSLSLSFGAPNSLCMLAQHAAWDRLFDSFCCNLVLWNIIAITFQKKKKTKKQHLHLAKEESYGPAVAAVASFEKS